MHDSSEPSRSSAGPVRAHARRSPAANALFDVIGFFYAVLLTIVLTPVILHFIGTEQYGIFALAMVFIGFLGLLDFGMAPAVTRFLSASLATSDFGEARSVLGVGLVFFLAVGVVGGVAAVVLAQWLPGIFSLSSGLEDTASFVISVAGAGFFFSSLLYPVCAVPGALQRFDTVTIARLISATAGALASVVVLWLGSGVRGLIIVAASQSALMLALVARSNKKLLPELKLRPAYDGSLMRRMISFSAYSFVSNAAGTVLLQVDKFVLGALASVSAVTYYVVPANLAQRLQLGVARLATVALPVTTDLHARGAKEELQRFYVRATRATALVIVSFAVPAFIFADEILRNWVGSSFAAESTVTLQILVVTYAALSLSVLPYYVTLGFARPQISALFNIVAALINVVLIFLLIPRYGGTGAAVAYLVSTAAVPALILYVDRRLLKFDASPWPALVGRLAVITVAQSAICLLLRPLSAGVVELLGLLLLSVATAPVLALLTGYLTQEDRATVMRFVQVARLVRGTR